ncbi:PREDICTED: prominin-1 isoform X2 [Miniopterus natalensis]|uniref:prominin-1 isoform X2 n=1 Tax=Miniopterus natalensis TaxID=291302 RepID=UPI0007A70660|nr:PREDICTED: prominin-1 isoform X2 [Miniopterus natalensis]
MALLLSILLLLGLCPRAASQGPSSPGRPEGLDFELPKANYETKDSYSPGPIGLLFPMVHLFLYVVQPNPFPEGILRKIIQRKFDLSTDYEKVIHYEMGILFCAAVGLLFIAVMPLVGLCFGVCRCRRKCGGEMHQRQRRNGAFLRKCYAASLLALIGILYGFAANHHLRTHIGKTRELADSNFKDLRTLLNQISSQVNYALDQYTTTKEKAFSDLDNVKSLLGGRIQEQLRPKVIPVLDSVKAMAEEIVETKGNLLKTSKSLGEAKKATAKINTDLQEVKKDLEQVLSDPVCSLPPQDKCEDIRAALGQLDNSTNLARLPPLNKPIENIDKVLQTNLYSLAQEGYKSFNSIPEAMEKQTTDMVSDVKSTLNTFGSNIETIKEEIAIEDMVSQYMKPIDSAEAYVRRRLPTLEEYDLYRWLGSLIVCCLLTLIILFYYLGLVCGTFGYDPNATPTRRGCVSNTGGIFLMVGVGISFLVCWIVMIIVVFSFVVGGNVQKLVCEPYRNKELFQILDTPYLLNENWKYYLSGMFLNKSDINLTFEQVYSDCKHERGIYAALKVENSYNVSDYLNVQKNTGNISNSLEEWEVKLDNMVLLDDSGRRNLLDFSHSGVDKIDFNTYLTEIAKPLTKVNLLTFADGLKAKADKVPEGNLKKTMLTNVQKIKTIYHGQVLPLESPMKALHQRIQDLQHKSSGLVVKVKNIIASLDSAQDFIKNNLSFVVVQESKKYGNTIIGYFKYYLQWLKIAITEKIATCKPVATALDSTVDVFLCNYIVEPMNLFWFGMGKATILLLPAIIFAVKLAKYFRRMDSEDVYEDVETISMKNVSKLWTRSLSSRSL